MSLLPRSVEVSPSPAEPAVLRVDGEEAADAFDALGSETARAVLATTYEEPKPPAEIRETVGTSLQNVHYHLDRLESAGLLEPAGTGYSAKGNEMTVYAPAREAVVLFAGAERDRSRLRDLLTRLFGLFAVVAVSTLVFAVLREWLRADPEPRVESMTAEDAAAAADGAAGTLPAVDPVVAFFLGGCVVVCALGAWWFLTRTPVIQYRRGDTRR